MLLNRILVKQLHMSTQNLEYLYYWGTKLPNGKYNGGLDLVKQKKADFLIGGASNNYPEIMMEFGTTVVYFDDKVIWLVPIAREKIDFFQFVYVFNKLSWLGIIVTFGSLTCAWIFIAQYSSMELKYFKVLWNASTMVLRYFFAELSHHMPRTRQLQLMYVLTWIFAFAIGSAFEGSLISKLAMKEFEHQISTIQEVLDKKLLISMPGFFRTSFLTSDPREQYIYNVTIQLDHVKLIEEAIARLIHDRDITTLGTQRSYDYMITLRNKTTHDFVFPDGSLAVYYLDDFSMSLAIVLIFQKGHPIFPQINNMLSRIFESGIYLHFLEEVMHNSRVFEQNLEVKKIVSKAISYKQISGLLYVWLLGLTLSILIFFGELLAVYLQ